MVASCDDGDGACRDSGNEGQQWYELCGDEWWQLVASCTVMRVQAVTVVRRGASCDSVVTVVQWWRVVR